MVEVADIDLLNNELMVNITSRYKKSLLDKEHMSYNLFNVSSYNSYLENFHSDIIASLLNPNGLHRQGDSFLNSFLDFLKDRHNVDIDPEDFQNVIVTRETGRLDIWIRDEISRKSIIVENKINNAPDMDDQIDRYVTYSESKRKYVVKSVVYLSLDGTKTAPPTREISSQLVINIGAFTNQHDDLVNGWLQPSLEIAVRSENQDSSSFIYQYIKLIKTMAAENLTTDLKDKFYEFVNTENGLITTDAVLELKNSLPQYRAAKFAGSLLSIAPFKKKYWYHPYHLLLENFNEGENNFKLDIYFDYSGFASVVLWNPGNIGLKGREAITTKLTAAGLLNEFDVDVISHGENGYPKYFRVGSDYKNIREVDEAITSFVKSLMEKLQLTING